MSHLSVSFEPTVWCTKEAEKMAMVQEWLGNIPTPERSGSFESGLDIDGAGRSGTSAPRWMAFRFSSARGEAFHERRAMRL
ncbi:hypothetical protein PG985_011158 [Apiospora marii]|uniref:uncharacterized protein n=1 Tax=Apiospora marii TaxID=335849 RepID=UPI003131F649